MIKLKTKILKTLSNSLEECSYRGAEGRLEAPLKIINRTGLNAGIYKVLYRVKEKLWSLQNN
jgi:hypothetical protein